MWRGKGLRAHQSGHAQRPCLPLLLAQPLCRHPESPPLSSPGYSWLSPDAVRAVVSLIAAELCTNNGNVTQALKCIETGEAALQVHRHSLPYCMTVLQYGMSLW